MIKRIFTRSPGTALGEVLMIVFGILIALQIDNWNENRKEAELRHSALEEVQAALKADLKHIEDRKIRADDIAESLAWLSDSLEDGVPYDARVARAFSRLQYSIVFEPRTGPFETLKANGLNVLDELSLQTSLINLYDYTYPRLQWMLEQELNHFNRTVSTPLMYEHFRLERKSVNESYHPAAPLSYAEMQQSPAVLTTIRRKADKATSIQARFERAREEVVRVLAAVDTALQ